MLMKRIAHLDALISSAHGDWGGGREMGGGGGGVMFSRRPCPPSSSSPSSSSSSSSSSSPPAAAAVVRSMLERIDRQTILISTKPEPPELPTDRPFVSPTTTQSEQQRASSSLSPSRNETDSERTDEDEQDMPDGFCHLFGILYSGHLLFPKYVPTSATGVFLPGSAAKSQIKHPSIEAGEG
ncbi:hypothetical protein D5F01_LYC20567 [Larimichthys crocea]|uniref:Uncharacterized protein n=1 Tax=Larimichthys crocea TaxID=215358 RepID=A0A6G0HQN8_LARCR|nr:hypothetical protein D5F01_LYC20567 [Larimichthys crocea]